MTRYRALCGLNWKPAGAEKERRIEACVCPDKPKNCEHVADDFLPKSIPWLLADGLIELVNEEPRGRRKPVEGEGE